METMQLQFHSFFPTHHGGGGMVSHYGCLNWSELAHTSSGLSVWDNTLWENISRFKASLVHYLVQIIKNYLPFFYVSLEYTDAI